MSIELPVATRHRRDMTEKLLKATLTPNKQQQQQQERRELGALLVVYMSVNILWAGVFSAILPDTVGGGLRILNMALLE